MVCEDSGVTGKIMGCLSVHIARVGEGLTVSSNRVGNGLALSCHRIGKGLEVSCGLVCSINSQDRVLWAKDCLVWIDTEVGVVKYNMLTATKEWSLSEVTIEDLL